MGFTLILSWTGSVTLILLRNAHGVHGGLGRPKKLRSEPLVSSPVSPSSPRLTHALSSLDMGQAMQAMAFRACVALSKDHRDTSYPCLIGAISAGGLGRTVRVEDPGPRREMEEASGPY